MELIIFGIIFILIGFIDYKWPMKPSMFGEHGQAKKLKIMKWITFIFEKVGLFLMVFGVLFVLTGLAFLFIE